MDRLERARKRMIEASQSGNASAFVAAKAEVEALTEAMNYALATGRGTGGLESLGRAAVKFDPKLHPRNREGEFMDVLAKLKRTPGPIGDNKHEVQLPGDIRVKRSITHYRVEDPKGIYFVRKRDKAAKLALKLYDSSKH